MIVGIGVDLVEIERIAKAMQNPRFINRILTKEEQKRPLDALYVAGRWAAKEALHKAVNLKSWHDVEIVTKPNGAPGPVWRTEALNNNNYIVHLSISHEHSHAVAMAVVETQS